jgi:regulatory protein
MYKPKKSFSQTELLQKAAHYCAYQERCHSEVREKLAEWGCRGLDAESIMAQLIEQNYLNEERFAIAFASGKFRTLQWGKKKIMLELKQRDLSDYCIQKALRAIDEDDYLEALKQLAIKKYASISDKQPFIRKQKTVQYLLSKGFEKNMIMDIVKEADLM